MCDRVSVDVEGGNGGCVAGGVEEDCKVGQVDGVDIWDMTVLPAVMFQIWLLQLTIPLNRSWIFHLPRFPFPIVHWKRAIKRDDAITTTTTATTITTLKQMKFVLF